MAARGAALRGEPRCEWEPRINRAAADQNKVVRLPYIGLPSKGGQKSRQRKL